MRRLSAILMIAALLAALVPSATLAGKPSPPTIWGVQVTGSYGTAPDCYLTFWTTFSGRAYAIRYTRWEVGAAGPDSSFPVPIPRKYDSVGVQFAVPQLATKAWYWKVALVDRKDNVLGTEVTTTAEGWSDTTSCPTVDDGTLAKYPPWQ
jgi:hypothetical protein